MNYYLASQMVADRQAAVAAGVHAPRPAQACAGRAQGPGPRPRARPAWTRWLFVGRPAARSAPEKRRCAENQNPALSLQASASFPGRIG